MTMQCIACQICKLQRKVVKKIFGLVVDSVTSSSSDVGQDQELVRGWSDCWWSRSSKVSVRCQEER